MSVDYHKHCQATVLSAYGTSGTGNNGNGATWNTINSLKSTLQNLPTNWITKFERSGNITDDLASILKLIDDTAEKLSKEIEEITEETSFSISVRSEIAIPDGNTSGLTNIATIQINDDETKLYAPLPTQINVTSLIDANDNNNVVQISDIKINGESNPIYAPYNVGIYVSDRKKITDTDGNVSYYTLWSDGWLEQCGCCDGTPLTDKNMDVETIITLPLAYKDTEYVCLVSGRYPNCIGYTTPINVDYCITPYTNKRIKVTVDHPAYSNTNTNITNTIPFYWNTCGYISQNPGEETSVADIPDIEYKKVTVKWDVNGGDGISDTSIQVNQGSKLSSEQIPSPTRNGYTLSGWYTKTSGGTKLTTDDVITQDTTYYAQWNQIQQYQWVYLGAFQNQFDLGAILNKYGYIGGSPNSVKSVNQLPSVDSAFKKPNYYTINVGWYAVAYGCEPIK